MKALAIVLIGLATSSCAFTNNNANRPTYHWEQEGVDAKQLGMDRAACRILAKQETTDKGYGWAVVGGHYEQYYNDCMMSKGWTLVQDRAPANAS